MGMRNRQFFSTITTEGSILPLDFLNRLVDLTMPLDGRTSDAYHLISGEKLNEAISAAWIKASAAWRAFTRARELPAADETGTTVTRERWLLPLFNEMQWGRLSPRKAIDINGRTFPISHGQDNAPIHLVGCNIDLDSRTAGSAGGWLTTPRSERSAKEGHSATPRRSPHGLLQEFLNASDDYLWGMVSNGLKLRILRDNSSLTRQAYVEFDLEAMMNGEVYADFAAFWLLCHYSSFESERPEECRLETWTRRAIDDGMQALDRLRVGVETAIEALGSGFLKHPANRRLRDRLESAELDAVEYYRQVLRLVYRLMFLFVAEDRDLLNLPLSSTVVDTEPTDTKTTPEKERYRRFYSVSRLRELALRRHGTHHGDLYAGLRLVMEKLGNGGCRELALPGLGSFLWSAAAIAEIADCAIENSDLLDAVRELTTTRSEGITRRVAYRSLATEELGSVYESLLEKQPQVNVSRRSFTLTTDKRNERKATGSYYTPRWLVSRLLDMALDPVIEQAAKQPNPAQSLLALKVCDPACGCGHFLIAAAHRIADRLAAVRSNNNEPSPSEVRHALRDVIDHCIYGVDVNSMAVELCKVALWLEALEPGKPLSFLDHHIQCGDSLLGLRAVDAFAGIPEDSYKPTNGDDRRTCVALLKRSRAEREAEITGEGRLFVDVDDTNAIAAELKIIESLPDSTRAQTSAMEMQYALWFESENPVVARNRRNAVLAAFYNGRQSIEDSRRAVTHQIVRDLDERWLPAALPWINTVREYGFFRWDVEFFPVAEARMGGFDAVIGNPPWLSLSGRQKAVTDPHSLAFILYRFPEISDWPAVHAAFLLLATKLARPGGSVGLVLPLPVAYLQGHLDVRRAVNMTVTEPVTVVDVGEKAFPGVTQATGLFSMRIGRGGAAVRFDENWNIGRSDTATVHEPDPLTTRLALLPTVRPKTFTDPGVHTGNMSKQLILDLQPDFDSYWPVREGKDISAYECRKPRKVVWLAAPKEGEQYSRIGSLETYVNTPILLRQTADRPIATMHRDPTYFRNSILACAGLPGVPDEVFVAILNSTLIMRWYRSSFHDAGQKAFPQIKVSNLQKLPQFDVTRLGLEVQGRSVGDLLREMVKESLISAPPSDDRMATLDDCVYLLYDIERKDWREPIHDRPAAIHI